jgi:glutathione S-transferase
MKLYDSAFSSNCRKVRIAAAELEIPLEMVPVDLFAGAARTAGYLALNPMGKVPALVDDGFVLWESTAICEYLASKRPERGLAPVDPRGRADMWRWLSWYSAHVQPWMVTLVVELRFKGRRGDTPDDGVVAHARGELARSVPVIDAHLAGRDHLLDAFSVADICLGVGFESAAFATVDLAPFGNIGAWLSRLQRRARWEASR